MERGISTMGMNQWYQWHEASCTRYSSCLRDLDCTNTTTAVQGVAIVTMHARQNVRKLQSRQGH
jgi:hypothetical protein